MIRNSDPLLEGELFRYSQNFANSCFIDKTKMEIEDNDLFHPRIVEDCLPLYLSGQYKHAALESMKHVEMALREKAVAPKDKFGTKLVDWVMGNGDHITLTVPLGDEYQEKAKILFKGAFAYYRNYAAHDGSNINKLICLRIMVIASELLDLISASRRSFERLGGIDGLVRKGLFKTAKEIETLLEFLNGKQIIEGDYSDFEDEYRNKGFTEIQVQIMFDLGFLTYDEEESSIDPSLGIFETTLIGEINLTEAGERVLKEIGNKISEDQRI